MVVSGSYDIKRNTLRALAQSTDFAMGGPRNLMLLHQNTSSSFKVPAGVRRESN